MTKSKPKTAKAKSIGVDAHTHVADSRTNIPSRETSRYAEEPTGKVSYPRDPSLDPQLVWKGKDEQDSHDFEIPIVPIHVQEKVHPQAIINDLQARSRQARPADNLFADFNGLDDDQKKLDFYQHEQHWTNRLILGDSLLAMNSLAEQERLRGKVQCIYFDPPYGIKFGSNWQMSTRKRDVKDAKAEDLCRQPEQVKAFRDTWELGIHSYLTYLRDRLTVARELLTETGSIFVQIGDENVHLVRCLLDEVFGAENFVVSFIVKKKGGTTPTDPVNDYLLWVAKKRENLKIRKLYTRRKSPGSGSKYTSLIDLQGNTHPIAKLSENEIDLMTSQGCKYARTDWPLLSQDVSERSRDFVWNGQSYPCARGRHWTYDPDTQMQKLAIANRLNTSVKRLSGIVYWDDWPYETRSNLWDDTGAQQGLIYVVQSSTKIIERCVLMTTDPGDLVLDPTCGAGTTAYVAEQWGRRWITIDTSRVALTLTRTRLMAAKFPYYIPTDSAEGRKKLREIGHEVNSDSTSSRPDLHQGFVYKTASRIKLETIVDNPDIAEGMTREQIDAAIRKHADSETLYDQPYEDKQRIRVTGPFTVESLSSHREISPVHEIAADTPSPTKLDPGNYLQTIFANLQETGVKGMTVDQRIGFSRLTPYAGHYIHAEGETDQGLAVRVSVGPELGTVGYDWVKRAADEAMNGSGCDVLLICAFHFDAGVHQQTEDLRKEYRFGKLKALPIRMNPDMAMFGDTAGQELLKKTSKANLFSVFGEPDITISKPDGKIVVTVNGVDVFDPATGEVRSGDADDIAAWFIDTNYDGDSFFVRHAYFLGVNDPYEKLKKALRADIDEAEWANIYSAESVPFDPPETGRFAVKVINHHGDEVLKVYTATPVL